MYFCCFTLFWARCVIFSVYHYLWFCAQCNSCITKMTLQLGVIFQFKEQPLEDPFALAYFRVRHFLCLAATCICSLKFYSDITKMMKTWAGVILQLVAPTHLECGGGWLTPILSKACSSCWTHQSMITHFKIYGALARGWWMGGLGLGGWVVGCGWGSPP